MFFACFALANIGSNRLNSLGMPTQSHIAVIGAGPAGLRAAECAAQAGARVTIYEAKSGPGRKLLVAGKSGLNLTFDEPLGCFVSRYDGRDLPRALWKEMIDAFDNEDLRRWSEGLGVETFVAPSGKVFPEPMRAAPLLRRWLMRLQELRVMMKTKHSLVDLDADGELITLTFQTDEGLVIENHSAVILALGGASWPKTGSDAQWVRILDRYNIANQPFGAANCGWEVSWPADLLKEAEGLPMKNLVVRAGSEQATGELMITSYGLEGSALYRLGRSIRSLPNPHLLIDFKPTMTEQELVRKLGKTKRGFVREARYQWNISPAAASLLRHLPDRGPWNSAESLAREVKACRVPLLRARPIEEAISSYGGVCWSEISETLMLKRLPRVFVCGEMVDWEAPTGGYLLQACFATGSWAGAHASKL